MDNPGGHGGFGQAGRRRAPVTFGQQEGGFLDNDIGGGLFDTQSNRQQQGPRMPVNQLSPMRNPRLPQSQAATGGRTDWGAK